MRALRILAGSLRFSRNSLWPRMTVRRLLKSWAMPPASWPIASILLTCRAARSAAIDFFSPSGVAAATCQLRPNPHCWLAAEPALPESAEDGGKPQARHEQDYLGRVDEGSQ